jgi:hypothetical protein
MILDGIVQHVLVRLDAENGFGEFDLADLLASHVVYVSFRHLRHSPSLFCTRRGLLRVDVRAEAFCGLALMPAASPFLTG